MGVIHHCGTEILSYESMYEDGIWSDTKHVTTMNRLRLVNSGKSGTCDVQMSRFRCNDKFTNDKTKFTTELFRSQVKITVICETRIMLSNGANTNFSNDVMLSSIRDRITW
ncbi:unnamed protein product [Schistosoma mattheei]|uniref:Uncharacterized protein n=1 Tax=Schistosoma mattheei TaxID=31246 RepID=A0AA85BRD7_9TREM|nr:unnamed protein product [Schistosoma mattheei]